jgi:hypothetical protein
LSLYYAADGSRCSATSRQATLAAVAILVALTISARSSCLDFKGLFGEPGTGLVKPLHCGFVLISLFFIWQKLNLQSQFHEGAAYRQIVSTAKKLSSRRLDDAKLLSTQARRLAMGEESFGGNV